MSSRVRITIVTEIIAPYRIPVFNAAAQREDIELHVIFLAESDPSLRQWRVYKDEIRFSYEVLPSSRWKFGKSSLLLNWGVGKALERTAPNVIVCGGYNYPASWRAARWARMRRIPFVLWSESTSRDIRKGRWLFEYAKARFMEGSDGFLVPGLSARNYLLELGVQQARIYLAPNAVDVDFFAGRSLAARQNASELRREFNLPERYFLCVGRLVAEKGVFDLVQAYERLSAEVQRDVGVVFVGDGSARPQLEALAVASPDRIRILGFLHREQLASVYALAEALVFPTHSDTWGLVVNEAMACGLPILVSEVAGCGADLVKNEWNGFVVPAGDLERWAEAMRSIATEPELRRMMGSNSESKIQRFGPRDWAAGLAEIQRLVEHL
jgi:glycosyltransferase involved in cell wall biosynthesis